MSRFRLLVGRRMPVRFWAIALLALVIPFPAAAQGSDDLSAPAHVAAVDGDVLLQREVSEESAYPGMPVVPGDRLRTARGRAEILFPDGSSLDVDEFTDVDLRAPTLVRVTEGRVLLTVSRQSSAGGARYRVDTPAASLDAQEPGEYRVSTLGTAATPQSEVAVFRGSALLSSGGGSLLLSAGERSAVWADGRPAPPQSFNSADFDAFDRWAAVQRDTRTGGRSAQYLPPDLRAYGSTLDQNGAWQYDSAYGYVWYPAVTQGWRPYYSGYWSSVPRYGWTWIGIERWAWPTHHYGRWGHARNRWFWIPGRQWGPGWVSWGAAPGYVGWCPLGWNNSPVFAFSVGVSAGPFWAGWTVLPRQHFGVYGRYVNHYAVPPRALPPRTPFVTQAGPPVGPPREPMRRVVGGARATAVPRPGRPGEASVTNPAGARGGVSAAAPTQAAGSAGRGSRSSAAVPRNGVAQPPPSVAAGADARGVRGSPGSVPRTGTARGVEGTPAQTRTPNVRTYPFGDFRGPRPEVGPPSAGSRRPGQAAPPSDASVAPGPGQPAGAAAPPRVGRSGARASNGSPVSAVPRVPASRPGTFATAPPTSRPAAPATASTAGGPPSQRGPASAVPRAGGDSRRQAQPPAGGSAGAPRSPAGRAAPPSSDGGARSRDPGSRRPR